MNVCVFCSASEVAGIYKKDAREFAKLLCQNGYGLIWGGSDHGLMKVIADEVQKAGGQLLGVSVSHLAKIAKQGDFEMIIAKDLGERKATMLARADALVVMVGGIGTVDEMTDVLEQKKHKLHDKPVVVLNTDNYYRGLKMQFEKMVKEGFVTRKLDELVHFADTPKEAIEYINRALLI